jgi:voltage-gated chloride channel
MAPWQRITLVAAGAGAGIAATFNTPIGGVMFAIELMLPEISARTFLPVALATGNAAVIRCASGNRQSRQGHRQSRQIAFTRRTSSKRRSEKTIPNLRRDTVVSASKFVMVEVMLQQGSRKNCGIAVGAIMDK